MDSATTWTTQVPEVAPFDLQPGINSWLLSLKTMAEYLTMVDVFFSRRPRHSGKVVVPKKLTKGVYAGGLFRRVLGDDLELILTIRHPAAGCVSTYEKSGGLPANGRFAVRSAIEGWLRRDLECTGCRETDLHDMDYFDVYLRYWEQFQLSVVTSGWLSNSALRIVAVGERALQTLAQGYHTRYGGGIRNGSNGPSRLSTALQPPGGPLEFPSRRTSSLKCW